MFMLEKAVVGSRRYWMWVLALLAVIGAAFLAYLRQFEVGLAITGLSRDVTWGLYIAQFTFLVGVAASAVMVVLPYYLHDYKAFGRITILGEFLAIASVAMCSLFIFVDMGQPTRVLNVMLYPTPNSMMFWDMVSLGGYLVLNALIALVTLSAERKRVAPPRWIKPVISASTRSRPFSTTACRAARSGSPRSSPRAFSPRRSPPARPCSSCSAWPCGN